MNCALLPLPQLELVRAHDADVFVRGLEDAEGAFAALVDVRGDPPGRSVRCHREIERPVRADRLRHRSRRLRSARVPSSVGVPGFEPGTFWSRTKRATKLRYTPRDEPIVVEAK